MEILINTWYNCDIDDSGRFELCKICRSYDPLAGWHIVTYYDGKEITTGDLRECFHWIERHYCGRRYLDHGKV